MEELQSMPALEDEIEVVDLENLVDEEAKDITIIKEQEVGNDFDCDNKKNIEVSELVKVRKEKTSAETNKISNEKEATVKQNFSDEEKEKEMKRKERKLLEAVVKNVKETMEEAKQKLLQEQEKLSKVESAFGEQLEC